MNKNTYAYINPVYRGQQEAIKEICNELNLIVFYPNYHAVGNDNNTVMIYTPEANEYNKNLPIGSSNKDYKKYVCFFENTDLNGKLNYAFMNHGQIDLRGLTPAKDKIKAFILQELEKYNQ